MMTKEPSISSSRDRNACMPNSLTWFVPFRYLLYPLRDDNTAGGCIYRTRVEERTMKVFCCIQQQ